MTTYEEGVRDSFSRMATDELLNRFQSGHLTEAAKEIALAELKTRGVDPDDPSSIARYQDAVRVDAEADLHEPLDGVRRGTVIRRMLGLIALIGIIPFAGYLVGRYVQWVLDGQWLNVVQRELGAKGEAALRSGQLTLDWYCATPDGLKEGACGTYHNVLLLQYASIGALVIGFALVVAIVAAARFASANRNLLVAVFSPGIKLVLFVVFTLIIVQGAIATYGAYIFEATAIHRVHFIVIGAIGLGAVIGAFTMINAGLSISHRASASVIGKSLTHEEQPRLWEFVTSLARKLDAKPPRHIVIGLEPNFYVTSADVAVMPEQATHRDETLYLSLPLMRILSGDELAAVIGHELGHFRGEDTKFSLRFYPIYAGTAQALGAIQSSHQGASSLALLPAFAILSLFLEEFAKAERTIGRERELEADKAGASVSSARALATSLLKIGAFATLWSSIRSAMVEALSQGKAYGNVSALYAEVASSSGSPELVDKVARQVTTHPTDTHPPTGQRIEVLGLSVSLLRNEALQFDASSSSALLLDNVTQTEEFLTDVEHRVLVELGQARLPAGTAATTSEPPPSNEPLGLCPNCERAIPASSQECMHCKAQFGEGSSWKVKPMPT